MPREAAISPPRTRTEPIASFRLPWAWQTDGATQTEEPLCGSEVGHVKVSSSPWLPCPHVTTWNWCPCGDPGNNWRESPLNSSTPGCRGLLAQSPSLVKGPLGKLQSTPGRSPPPRAARVAPSPCCTATAGLRVSPGGEACCVTTRAAGSPRGAVLAAAPPDTQNSPRRSAPPDPGSVLRTWGTWPGHAPQAKGPLPPNAPTEEAKRAGLSP